MRIGAFDPALANFDGHAFRRADDDFSHWRHCELVRASEPKLPRWDMNAAYFTVGHTHLNAALVFINERVECTMEALWIYCDGAHCLDPEKIRRKDPKLIEACASGLLWTVCDVEGLEDDLDMEVVLQATFNQRHKNQAGVNDASYGKGSEYHCDTRSST